jgi:ubiquinol-cytochrome c reductase iron-sulfur subunit
MSENEQRREGGLGAFLELGWGLLQLGWTSLKFLASVVNRVSPLKLLPEPIAESGRAADRETESESDMEHRERWGTLFVICAFIVALAGGVGFLICYWSGRSSNAILGGSLAVFLGGMGITLVLWARWLMDHKQAVEPRHVLQSSLSEREGTAEAFCGGARDVRRRRLLKWMGLTGVGVLGSMVLSLLRSLGMSPDASLYSRVWQGGQRLVTLDGKPVSLNSLVPGSTVTVFPEDKIGSERAQTVLIRVKEQLLQLPEERASWAPGGYVAYSRVCTHAGCPVGEFQAEQSLLLCPCHQSTFDVLRAAAPTGGPAARPLPQLPLYADADGTLRAGGGFTAPPGPGFWGIS